LEASKREQEKERAKRKVETLEPWNLMRGKDGV
jgi:hypothetical protein